MQKRSPSKRSTWTCRAQCLEVHLIICHPLRSHRLKTREFFPHIKENANVMPSFTSPNRQLALMSQSSAVVIPTTIVSSPVLTVTDLSHKQGSEIFQKPGEVEKEKRTTDLQNKSTMLLRK